MGWRSNWDVTWRFVRPQSFTNLLECHRNVQKTTWSTRRDFTRWMGMPSVPILLNRQPLIQVALSQLSKIFLAQRRLQNLGVVNFNFGQNDILILHLKTPRNEYSIVLLDFANCISKEARLHESKISKDHPMWQKDPDLCVKMENNWRGSDEHVLAVNLSRLVGGAMWEWKTMEHRRGTLGLTEE